MQVEAQPMLNVGTPRLKKKHLVLFGVVRDSTVTYLYGVKFTLLTDHKPLKVIYSTSSRTSARIERWVLRLQPYKFTVQYVPGKQNIADPLSRLSKGEGVCMSSVAGEFI